jgi:hypothetical protein
MIKCPNTGRPIATGLKTDRSSFEAMAVFYARTFCPICRTNHQWFARDAWVSEAQPRPRMRLVQYGNGAADLLG